MAYFSWKDGDGSYRLMVLVVLTLGIFNMFLGDKIPAGNGFGYDGVTYAYMVRHLDVIIQNGELSPYYAHRILAPALVHFLLKVSGAAFSDVNIIRTFEVYNLALLMISVVLWRRLSHLFAISLGGLWIGFAGLFLSFMGSKLVFYYPVLTDVTGLFFGILLLLLYLEKKPFALFITTLIGSFAWPLVNLCGVILLVLMGSNSRRSTDSKNQEKLGMYPACATGRQVRLAWVATLLLCLLGLGLLAAFQQYTGIKKLFGFAVTIWARGLTGLPSLSVIVIMLLMLAESPAAYLRSVLSDLKKSPAIAYGFALLVLSITWFAFHYIQSAYNPASIISNPGNLTIKGALNLLLTPVQTGKLLLPLVSLAVYWGPVVLVLMLTWKHFCQQARALGSGFVAVVALILPLCLAAEPRFITFAWPFFVLGAVLSLEKIEKENAFKYVFSVLVLLYSHFWMKINLAPWTGNDLDGLADYPKQIFFMHFGMWMNWWAYCLQLILIVVSALWLRNAIGPRAPGNCRNEIPSLT